NVGIGTTAPVAALEVGTNGAASTPGELLSGTWFTGGSATTTKPQLLIEPTGTTSTNWSTSGTGLGINSGSSFAGNLLDLQVGAVKKVYLPANAGLNITNATTNGTAGTATTIVTGDPTTKGLVVKATTGTVTLLTNIIAYWKFDEGSGTVVEDIVGVNEGTTHGSSAWTSSGKIDDAGLFSVANANYTSVGNDSSLNFTGAFSISTWIYPTAAGDANGFTGIVHKGTLTTSTSDPYAIYFLSNRKLRFAIDSATTGKTIDSTTVLSLDTWYHVVVVYDGANVSIFLNGNATPDTTDTTTITTLNTVATEVYIGASKFGSNPYRYFTGRIDETGIWTKALTTTEIAQLYNSGSGNQYDFGVPTQTSNLTEWQDNSGSALSYIGPTGTASIA
ncbi:LamG domain-containing protein, partial [candidate division WWE3 bacterium]|nr:LamG domain-containing protein [candidate division WWE3 bacterium]